MVMGAIKVQRKSRHRVHMTPEVDLEVNLVALPAEPRCSGGELFLSQLSAFDTIQTSNYVLSSYSEILKLHISVSAGRLNP